MRGKRNDQGGRWPLGIWFALVGMSAGTVASFSLIGWTFTRGLYVGGGAEPLEYESETVILEAEVTTGPEGIAGGDAPEGLIEPGAVPEFAASPAEPRAERMPEADGGGAPAHDPRDGEPESERRHPARPNRRTSSRSTRTTAAAATKRPSTRAGSRSTPNGTAIGTTTTARTCTSTSCSRRSAST